MAELYIPDFSSKEWEKAIKEATGPERTIIQHQYHATQLFKHIDDKQAKPKRIAWYSLWLQTFSLLEGARSALYRNSLYTLNILSRVVEELSLQVFTVIEPQQEMSELRSSHLKVNISDETRNELNRQTVLRLEAYRSWCFWNDLDRYRNLLKPEVFEALWDDSIRWEIARDENEKMIYEKLFGPLQLSDPEELQKQRDQTEAKINNKLELLES